MKEGYKIMFNKADKKLLKTKDEKLAKDIINFLLKHELFDDAFVYVNDKRYGTYDGEGHYNYGSKSWDTVFVEDNMNPRHYFEYAGPHLSMSFEGPLYDILNYSFESEWAQKLEDEFTEIFKKHGYYYELGNAWNLTAVEA